MASLSHFGPGPDDRRIFPFGDQHFNNAFGMGTQYAQPACMKALQTFGLTFDMR
jgi:hypothetical protein